MSLQTLASTGAYPRAVGPLAEPAKIRHFVFDIGNVLVRFDPHLAYLNLLPDPETRSRFLNEVCSPAWLAEQDRGRSWAEGEAELIARHPEASELITAFRSNFHTMVPEACRDSVEVVQALIAAGADVTALSNMAVDIYLELRMRFGFLNRFRGVSISGYLGMIKPEQAIYDRHVVAFDLDPEATLFFDDNPDNVAAARDAGWHAEHYTGGAKLRRDLKRYGVEV